MKSSLIAIIAGDPFLFPIDEEYEIYYYIIRKGFMTFQYLGEE